MDTWAIPLLYAIGGAVAALGGRELVEWYKRPRLEINFEERNGQKPFIPDDNWEEMAAIGKVYKIKHFRLIVKNRGKKPAMNCEAKLEINIKNEGNITSNKVALHWSRINLNINDEEPIEVLQLPYSFSSQPDTDHNELIPYGNEIRSASFRELVLHSNVTYQCIVTVYSSNTNPKSFKFEVKWDGKVEGYNKAFTKV